MSENREEVDLVGLLCAEEPFNPVMENDDNEVSAVLTEAMFNDGVQTNENLAGNLELPGDGKLFSSIDPVTCPESFTMFGNSHAKDLPPVQERSRFPPATGDPIKGHVAPKRERFGIKVPSQRNSSKQEKIKEVAAPKSKLAVVVEHLAEIFEEEKRNHEEGDVKPPAKRRKIENKTEPNRRTKNRRRH